MRIKKTMIVTLAVMLTPALASAQPSQSGELPSPGLTPDNPLYNVEKAVEKIEIGIASLIGEDFEAKVRANKAEERLSEKARMIDKNRTEYVETLSKEYSNHITKSKKLAADSKNEELGRKVEGVSRRQETKLRELKQKTPPQAQKGIDKAIENAGKPLNPSNNRGKPADDPRESQPETSGRGTPEAGRPYSSPEKGDERGKPFGRE